MCTNQKRASYLQSSVSCIYIFILNCGLPVPDSCCSGWSFWDDGISSSIAAVPASSSSLSGQTSGGDIGDKVLTLDEPVSPEKRVIIVQWLSCFEEYSMRILYWFISTVSNNNPFIYWHMQIELTFIIRFFQLLLLRLRFSTVAVVMFQVHVYGPATMTPPVCWIIFQ